MIFLVCDVSLFLSTLSLRRATWPGLLARPFFLISIHALLAESDTQSPASVTPAANFYPRSPCGERHGNYPSGCQRPCISIHALLAESDPMDVPQYQILAISIHALLAESDAMQIVIIVVDTLFLSTLSLRRATRRETRESIGTLHFYPRSPCGERHRYGRPVDVQFVFLSTLSLRRATAASSGATKSAQISIHALLAESDG